MDAEIIKLSADWAKAEVFSGKIVLFFSIIYISTGIAFWFLGKTGMAKAFIWPSLIAGVFLVAVGAGLYFANHPRVENFERDYRKNPGAFIKKEIARTASSQAQLTFVLRILPSIVIAGAIIILFFPQSSVWRAIAITLIITAAFLMMVDSNTDARNTAYHFALITLQHSNAP